MIIEKIFNWLLDWAGWFLSFLPQHTPIDWPELGPWFDLFQGLATLNRVVPVAYLFVILAIILIAELATAFYIGLRAVYGAIPALK